MSRAVRSAWALLALVAGLCLAGCEFQQPLQELAHREIAPPRLPETQTGNTNTAAQPVTPYRGDTIRIASFNIQVFGTSKLGKPHVMEILANVVRRFDVVAIQEVRALDQTVVPRFVELVNAEGARYDCVIGPRLGRTSSKEQYAFLFDTSRIELDHGCIYTTEDRGDLLHREPLAARFRVRGVPPERAFTFTLVNIHTDPDETDTELDALADVFVAVQHDARGEDDVILLGDLNVDEYHLGRLGQLANVAPAISGTTTNTRRNRLYDNIVFQRRMTTEYAGHWGVLDLIDEFQLTEQAALEVSDHFPVWAEFSVYESGAVPSVAARPEPVVR